MRVQSRVARDPRLAHFRHRCAWPGGVRLGNSGMPMSFRSAESHHV